jgi:Zn-dependent M28 family amino/carboxypeptidase
MKKLITAIALVAVSAGGFAQDVDRLIQQADVERIIKTLSADDMQGRATFTPGIEKAAKFIENEFKTIGLTPLEGNSGFRQSFSMIKSTPISTAISINDVVVPADNIAAFSAASINWNGSGAEIARVTADMDLQNDFRKFLGGDKPTLVIVDPKFEAFFKRLSAFALRGNTTAKDAPAQAPVVFVLGSYGDVKTYKVKYDVKSTEMPLFNVAGMLPGKSKAKEFVIFSGHYDHLGIVAPMAGDSIANGADDDATGTTAVITLAKYFKRLNNNERTLIFVAFTAEEIGGYGSQYFSKHVSADQTVAMFNIEMIGKASKFGTNSAFITGFERSDFGTILQKNLEGTAFKFHPDPYPEQQLFYRSDNATLARLGVPAHSISTDQIDTDKLYHSVKDEFSSLDVSNIAATIKAIALSSRGIVAGKDTPSRVAKLER